MTQWIATHTSEPRNKASALTLVWFFLFPSYQDFFRLNYQFVPSLEMHILKYPTVMKKEWNVLAS